jgi:hypothetical protein
MDNPHKLARQFSHLDHPDDRVVVIWARTLSNWLRLYGLSWADVAHLVIDSQPQMVDSNVEYWQSPAQQPVDEQWLPHVQAVDRILKSSVGALNDGAIAEFW